MARGETLPKNGAFLLLRIITSGIIFVLAIYSLITKNFVYMPYMLLLLGVSVLITGVWNSWLVGQG